MRRLPRGRFVQAKLRIPTSFRGLHRRRHRSWSLSPPTCSASTMPVSTQFLEKLDAARKGQGHAQPGASAEKVIEATLDLLLAQQAIRWGAVKAPRKVSRPTTSGHVTAAVKRAVWTRDDGKCTWPIDSGGVCGSTLRLEIGHVVSRGRGGASTVENRRLACATHHMLAARQVHGDDWMDQFTGGAGMNFSIAREPSSAQLPATG